MTFFLKVADNEKWQADFRKMSVYEKMTIISWTQYLKRLWFISSTKHEMSLHLLIHPNMVAVISRFDKYVEIWIEHKRKTCIDGYYKKSLIETVMASTVKLGYVCLLFWYMVKSYYTFTGICRMKMCKSISIHLKAVCIEPVVKIWRCFRYHDAQQQKYYDFKFRRFCLWPWET